jgi:hypothetical protein
MRFVCCMFITRTPNKLVALTLGPLFLLLLGVTSCSSPTSTTPATMTACSSSQLGLSGSWQGATGSLAGGIYFTNRGGQRCFLDGYMKLTLLNSHAQTMNVGVRVSPINVIPTVARTATRVVLPPGRKAAWEAVQWFNWCGPYPGAVSIQVALPGGAIIRPTVVMGQGGARCDSPRSPSYLNEGPVQVPPS